MQFCTFWLGSDLFGVPVLEVQEVVRQHEITRVPLAPQVVRGLINLRGNIVSTVDMRQLLRMDPLSRATESTDGSETVNVIVRVSSGLISLLVDRIGDVIDAPEDRCESVPSVLAGEIRQIITRVYKLPGNLLMILNPDRIAEFDRARISVAE